jgi:hypothetical protein
MHEFKSYSQYGEDKILKNLLGDSGYFLEVGSFHPFAFSNTRFLVEMGWSGCYVDGSPSALNRFIIEYKNNDKIDIVNALVGDVNGLITFYDSIDDGISSTDVEHMKRWKQSGSPFKKIYATMITFDILYNLLPSTVDFINIDVEGQSAHLSTLMDYNRLNTKVICIEHDNQEQRLREHFSSIGYYPHYSNHTNIIFVKNSL